MRNANILRIWAKKNPTWKEGALAGIYALAELKRNLPNFYTEQDRELKNKLIRQIKQNEK